MRTINKGQAPICLSQQPPNQKWGDFIGSQCHQEVHQCLREEQHSLCCYCECSLKQEDGHIEHLEPQSISRKRIYDYSNLAISCSDIKHCGHYKGNNWDATKFSAPDDPKTAALFHYSRNGTVEAAGQDILCAQYLIDCLGLNCRKLKGRRKNHADIIIDTLGASPNTDLIDWLRKRYLKPDHNTGQLKPFPSLSKAVLEPYLLKTDIP